MDHIISLDGVTPTYVPAVGNFYRVITASADVYVGVNSNEMDLRPLGVGENVPGGFTSLYVHSDTAQQIRLTVVDGEVTDNRLALTEPLPIAAGMSNGTDVSIGAATSGQVAPVNANRFAIDVRSPTSNIVGVRIGGAGVGAGQGIELLPGERYRWETTAAIHVYNPHTAAQTIQFIELNR